MTKPESKRSKTIRKNAPKLISSACTGVRPHERLGKKVVHLLVVNKKQMHRIDQAQERGAVLIYDESPEEFAKYRLYPCAKCKALRERHHICDEDNS